MAWTSQSTWPRRPTEQVLIKNGSTYIRVHPCRLQLINQNSENNQGTPTSHRISNESDKHNPQPHNKFSKNQHHLNIENSENEDEDPNTRKSANRHSLNQTINYEIQGQPHHEHINSKLKKVKPKTKIKYKVHEDDEWESAEITKRAGKASGKKHHWWNIRNLSGNEQSLNLDQIYDFEIQRNKPRT